MALKITDAGVLSRTGRGKNAVEVLISFAEIDAWASRMVSDIPKLWRRAYGRVANALQQKFRKVMRVGGGVEGVPKFRDFEEFTKELREKRGIASRRMGGILANPRNIVKFLRNGAQVIGWPDSLADWSAKFQEGRTDSYEESRFSDPSWRAGKHRLGIRDVPRAYVHNERMVLEPWFIDYARRYLGEWANGAYYKMVADMMIKQAARANAS